MVITAPFVPSAGLAGDEHLRYYTFSIYVQGGFMAVGMPPVEAASNPKFASIRIC
jgi:hypothetical protein